MLDKLPETVYRVCDLLSVVTQRNGSEWRDSTLETIVAEVRSQADQLLKKLACCGSNKEALDILTTSDEALKFGTRLHLLSLLLEVHLL